MNKSYEVLKIWWPDSISQLLECPRHFKFKIFIIIIIRMYTQKKNYILQLKVSRFHDHQAILQSKDQSYILYCEIGGT